MELPEHMEITASLMAGHRLDDGSLIEVDRAGDYRITNAAGEIIADTVDTDEIGLRSGAGGPPRAEDYGDILDNLAAFLCHDGDFYGATRGSADLDEAEVELNFGWRVAEWAYEHEDELSILANWMEDKRLGEADCGEEF